MTDQPGPADWPPGEGVPPEPPNVGDAAGATVEQPGAGQVVAGPAADEVQLAGEQERLAPLEWPDDRRPAPANPPKRRVTLRRAGGRSVALPGTPRQRVALGGAAIGVGVLAAVVAIAVARPSVGGEATAARQSFAPASAPASVAVGVSAQPSLVANPSVLLPSAGSGGVAVETPPPSTAVSLGTCNGLGAPDTWVGGPQGAAAAVDLPAIPFPGQPVGSAPAVLRPPALTPPGGVATAQEADVVAKATRDQGSQGTNRWFVVQSGSRYYAFAGTDLGSAAAPSPSAAAAPCRVDPSSYSLAALHAMAFVPGASGNRAFAFDYLTGQQATITDVSTGQIVWRGAIGAPTPSSQPGAGQGTQPPTGSASATPSQASLAPGSSPATAPESPPATQAGSSPGQGGIGIIPTQAGRTAEAWLLSVALGRRAGLSNCATEAVPDPEDGVIAFARCGYAIGPEGVTFRLFRDGPSLDAYVAGRRSDGRGNRTDVCPQQWQWKPGAPEGVMLCSDATVKGKPYGLVQWTERDWHIFGNLAVPNGDVRNLYTHWLTDIIVDSPSAHQPQ